MKKRTVMLRTMHEYIGYNSFVLFRGVAGAIQGRQDGGCLVVAILLRSLRNPPHTV